jgi:protein-tyrosine kinase
MGRMDDALRRSDVDAARDTGAVAPVPAPSPWLFEQQDARDASMFSPPIASEPTAGARPDGSAAGEGGLPAPWDRLDASVTERLVVASTAGPLLVEQFRSLAATLHQVQNEHHVKSVVVTSPSRGDGKSHVAVNLALTLSESYKRQVLLVDADLRRPTLHQVFGIPNTRGLGDALKAKADEKLAVVRVSEALTLLPAGRPEPNPLGGLSSNRMLRIIEDAGSRFDWVIVDSPPVGLLADGRLVSEAADAAILVVRAGGTRFPDLQAAVDAIGRERILGIVLNAVDPIEVRGEGHYRHYSGGEGGEGHPAG